MADEEGRRLTGAALVMLEQQGIQLQPWQIALLQQALVTELHQTSTPAAATPCGCTPDSNCAANGHQPAEHSTQCTCWTCKVREAHRIDHKQGTALHEQCTCGKRWMRKPDALQAHRAELLDAIRKTAGFLGSEQPG